MDRKIKRLIILGLIIFVGIGLLLSIVLHYLKTGVNIAVQPEGSYILLDGSEIEPNRTVPAKPGTHSLSIYTQGYKKVEQSINVKRLGTTKINVTLANKLKPLLSNLPHSSEGDGGYFKVNGRYNDYLEPEYTVNYYDEPGKKSAEKWLRQNGVNPETYTIRYLLDGD